MKREIAVAAEIRDGRFHGAVHLRCDKTAFLPMPEITPQSGAVVFPIRILEMEEVRADPKTQAPFGVAKFSATAHANLATIKVEDPLDVARRQTEASNRPWCFVGK